MKFAYADPPYPGCAHRYPEKREVDHKELIEMLCRDFPDGWALSTHVPGLRLIWPMCPEDVRVGAWTKTFSTGFPNERVARCWEPVIFRGGRETWRAASRRMRANGSPVPFSRDAFVGHPGCGLGDRRHGTPIVGAKPARFCYWLFELLGAQPGDELVDLFPGTGGVTRAWDTYLRQLSLFSNGPRADPAPRGTPSTSKAPEPT